MKVGELSKIPFKGVKKKIGEEKKTFQKGGQARPRALKREGGCSPLTNYGRC